MKLELQSAANFLVHLIRRRHTGSDVQLEKFRVAIVEVLRRRYRDHWFPEKPCKGSGYRCIRINGKIDPIIAQAAEIVGMPTNTIHQTFPSELTMWIDPLEVSYRIGENGSICILYEYKENQGTGNAPWRPAPVPTTQSRSKTSSPTTLVGGKGSTTSGSRSTATSQQSNTSVSSSPVKQLQQSNQVSLLPKSTPSSPKHHSSNLNNVNNLNHLNSSAQSAQQQKSSSACKDSLYKIDFLIDPRKSASISEHLAAYVSS